MSNTSGSEDELQHIIKTFQETVCHGTTSTCTLMSYVIWERSAILNQPVGTEKLGQAQAASLQESNVSTRWHFSVDRTGTTGERRAPSKCHSRNRHTIKFAELLCCRHLVPGACETICPIRLEVTWPPPGLPTEAPRVKHVRIHDTLDPRNVIFAFGGHPPHTLSYHSFPLRKKG